MTRKKTPAGPSPFGRVPESPRIDAAFRGIVITAPPRVAKPAGTLVHGAVQVPEKDFDPGAGVLDAVALVVTSPPGAGPFRGGGMYRYAWMPFRDRIVLADDVERGGGIVRGYFRVALPRDLPPSFDYGEFFIVASVGSYASDVLTVKLG